MAAAVDYDDDLWHEYRDYSSKLAGFKIVVNDPFIPFLQHHKRFKVLYGGRGSGKSQFIALCMGIFATQGERICCFREHLNSIEESVMAEIWDEIQRVGLTGFTKTNNKIKHTSGGFITFRGMSRNPSSLKSMKGFNKFWLEEGQDVSEESLRYLTPTLRAHNAELWISANPKAVADTFSQRFIERELNRGPDGIEYDDMYMRLHVNYNLNPWFPHELELERADDYERLERSLYSHIWLGAYNDTVADAIIKAEHFDAAVMAHHKLKWRRFGAVTGTHDPADSGDARSTLVKHGNIVIATNNDIRRQINAACDFACEFVTEHGANHFIYDADGVGMALRQQVNDYFKNRNVEIYEYRGNGEKQDPDDVIAFDSSDRPIKNCDFYKNLRAQMYSSLANDFEKTYRAIEFGEYIDPHELISIDDSIQDLQKLKSELTSIPRYRNSTGTYQIMSKKDMMTKLKVKSPNLADCLAMSKINLRMPNAWGKPMMNSVSMV